MNPGTTQLTLTWWRDLLREAAREADDPGLRRGVVGLADVPLGRARGHQHDLPRALRDQLRGDGPAGDERGAEVEVDHLVPLLVGHLVEERVLRPADERHEDVDPAELLDDRRDDPAHVIVRARVGLDE
jgi:hypothetical protein